MEQRSPQYILALRSVKWRVTAGWVVVAIITWRYLAHPMISTYLVVQGHEPLPPLDPIAVADAAAIIGLPVGGSFADKMTGDT